MTEQLQDVQETNETVVTRVFGLGRKTFLAGVGAVSLAQDGVKKGWEGGNEFAGMLVERGETMSQERREQIAARTEKGQEQAAELRKGLGERVGETYIHTTEAVLTRANVPTRTDIQDLSKQIDSLSRKVDKVRKEQKEAVAA